MHELTKLVGERLSKDISQHLSFLAKLCDNECAIVKSLEQAQGFFLLLTLFIKLTVVGINQLSKENRTIEEICHCFK